MQPIGELSVTEDPAAIAVRNADLQRALATLGPNDDDLRELAKLMYLEDRPVAEVAELLGIPQGTVKSRASRFRRLLRSALQGGDV